MFFWKSPTKLEKIARSYLCRSKSDGIYVDYAERFVTSSGYVGWRLYFHLKDEHQSTLAIESLLQHLRSQYNWLVEIVVR